jgi:hypothetical protein
MESTDDTLLTSAEVARLLNVGLSTFRAWQREGIGPEAVRLGRPDAKRHTIRFRPQAVRSFVEASHE